MKDVLRVSTQSYRLVREWRNNARTMCNIVFLLRPSRRYCYSQLRIETIGMKYSPLPALLPTWKHLNSLACFAWEQPLTCWPQITDEPVLSIEQGIHPLIEPQEVVANCLNLEPKEPVPGLSPDPIWPAKAPS